MKFCVGYANNRKLFRTRLFIRAAIDKISTEIACRAVPLQQLSFLHLWGRWKRETGKRENGLVMESRSILNNRHTSRCYFKTD